MVHPTICGQQGRGPMPYQRRAAHAAVALAFKKLQEFVAYLVSRQSEPRICDENGQLWQSRTERSNSRRGKLEVLLPTQAKPKNQPANENVERDITARSLRFTNCHHRVTAPCVSHL